MRGYQTGAQLLEALECVTREQKLEQAVKALMEHVEELHIQAQGQSLKNNLDNTNIFCSCADAYRMGHEALK